ncbi:MAG: hypothetical protein ACK55I_02520, partial [bacterium]
LQGLRMLDRHGFEGMRSLEWVAWARVRSALAQRAGIACADESFRARTGTIPAARAGKAPRPPRTLPHQRRHEDHDIPHPRRRRRTHGALEPEAGPRARRLPGG